MIAGIVAEAMLVGAHPPQVAALPLGFDGGTFPFYGNLITPHALYVSATATTWFCWESILGPGLREARVTSFDHESGIWGDQFTGATYTSLTNDDHGNPAIIRDADGYLHLFYGGHQSNVFESVSRQPDDAAEWRVVVNTFSGSYAYPRPFLVGSTLYIFFRDSNNWLTRFKTTAIAGGTATWGSAKRCIEFSGARLYSGAPILVGTAIHIPVLYAEVFDTRRTHQYYFVYQTADDSIGTIAGTNNVAPASQPIAQATADTTFRVFVCGGSDVTDVPGFCIDTAGQSHLVFPNGPNATATGDPFPLTHIMWNGSAWTAPASVGANVYRGLGFGTGTIEGVELVALPGGAVALYYPEDAAGNWARGGNLTERVRSSGGSWGSDTTILMAGASALGQPHRIVNGPADLRVLFCEHEQDALDIHAGAHKIYAYGASGIFGRADLPPSDLTLSSTTVAETESVGAVIAQILPTFSHPTEPFTYSILSDPDGVFDLSGRELLLNASVSAGATHYVRLRARDGVGHRRDRTFAITVVASRALRDDAFRSSVALLLDGQQPGAGTDPNFASVQLLIDGS